MKGPRAPRLESRRAAQFTAELQERARAWIPQWDLADSESDFGRALLQVAARFSSEVAERLDGAGEKMRRGFLDWLAVRGEAARPARLPIVFKLAATAREAILASAPVRLQVDVSGSPVVLESEKDVNLVPGTLDLAVGADPTGDAFFTPPPGMSSLDPLEPLPEQWRLKSFAAAGSATLQLDPGLGLVEGMLLEIDGAQFRIAQPPKEDLVTIEPPLGAEGLAIGTLVKKVSTFDPFDGARNQQNHILYLGHPDVLNLEAKASIDVVGTASLGPGVTWEYWGKIKPPSSPDDAPAWRELAVDGTALRADEAIVLLKPAGAVEPRKIGAAEGRWIRARTAHLDGSTPVSSVDQLALRVNVDATGLPPDPLEPMPPDEELPPVEVIVNTTVSPSRDFYPLGREPHLFDAFYLGCAEAFSKPGARARVRIDLAEPAFEAMAALDAGAVGDVLTGVDKAGTLHVLSVGPDGKLKRLADRPPARPGSAKLTSRNFRPALAKDGDDLLIAVVAGNDVWSWREDANEPQKSGWEKPLGAPAADADPNSVVTGLASVDDGGIGLVALRDGMLYRRRFAGGAWVRVPAVLVAGDPEMAIAAIAPVLDSATRLPTDEIVVILDEAQGRMCHGTPWQLSADPGGGADQLVLAEMLDGMSPEFGPFAMKLNADLEAVGVVAGRDKFRAWRSTGPLIQEGDFEAPLAAADATSIDGRIEGGNLFAYMRAKNDLLAWAPFHADVTFQGLVFLTRNDPTVGIPKGSVSLADPGALLPGTAQGEVLAALITGARTRWDAQGSDLRSALALRNPAPVVIPGVTLVAPDAPPANRREAVIDNVLPVDGRGAFSGDKFIWLDRWLDVDTSTRTVFFYSLTLAPMFTAVAIVDTRHLELDPTGGAQEGDLLRLTDTASTEPFFAKILHIVAGVAELDADMPATVNGEYWEPLSNIPGRIFPSLDFTGSSPAWPIASLDHGDLYFPALSPNRQPVAAVGEFTLVPTQPERLAFEFPWTADPTVAAIVYYVVDAAVSGWIRSSSDTTANPALSWEYWNGTGWSRLTLDAETTNHLKNSGHVMFAVPADLKPGDWAGKTNYWVRARLVGGDYGRESVVAESTTTGGVTTQTIKRTTEGIQPPYALAVWVRYEINQAVVPTFLLTQDSGTLRNQSDANRTLGALVEVFTPLIATLRRLDGESAAAPTQTDGCVPDCECAEGEASASPQPPATATPASDAPVAARGDRRALYLGFDGKLSGTPVNVLFVVGREMPHDVFAPMTLDALVGDHFVPILADDMTRAVGESGVVSMSFSVEPTPAELFGKTLRWLRLAPAAGDETAWKPNLRGAYLNAVWASAAESLTRELVGSSDGSPNIRLRLARPPVLRDSLELRVREPLGDEERAALREAKLVESDVENLPGDWVLWRRVIDPLDEGPRERVYALEEETGEIRFGDGRHGAVPPTGRDSIVAFRYKRTEVAAGSRIVPANSIAARMPLNLISPVESVEAVFAADAAAGGAPPEPAERVLRFGSARLRHRNRAVTTEDFEDLALQSSPDIVQARCFVRRGAVRLVVVMRGTDPTPNAAEVRELKRLLLAAAPAALAAPHVLLIEGPAIRRLRVGLRLNVASLDPAGALARDAKKRIAAFFDTATGGVDADGWALGANPRDEDIAFALLDAPSLEGIDRVTLEEIAQDAVARPWTGGVRPGELVLLDDDGVRVEFAVVEVIA